MRSTEGSLIASQVVRVRERFERWRRDHPGRRPLPAELWSAAVNLARQYGLSRTANALRLSSDSLKQHIQTDAAGGRKRRKPQTPARFIERLRVEAARQRLEESHTGLAQVARECGFGSADSMRRSFLRVLHVAPADYRNRFQHNATLQFRNRA